ncbi:hypothetical protein [Clostridium sp. ETTB3]
MNCVSGNYSRRKVGISYSTIFITMLSLVFLFQNVLELYFPFTAYIEDIISVVFFIYFVVSVFQEGKINKTDMFFILILIAIIFWGTYSNVAYKIQTHAIAIMIDLISNFKFLMIYLGFSCYLKKRPNFRFEQVNKVLVPVAKGYIIILFTCAVLNIFVDIGMYQEYRYGLRTFSFIFGTPGQVINTTICILLILCMDRDLNRKKINNSFFIFITWLVLISTLKSRALILAITFFLLYETFEIEKRRSIKLRILMVTIVGCIIGYSQFEYYFLSGSTPRLRFFKIGIEIFKEYFPFGSGFATFGSSAAAKYYSPLYYRYGFNNFYGMSPDDPAFLNDTFWPMIFGQLGLIGTILFLLILGKFLMKIYQKVKGQSNIIKLAVFFYIFNVIFSSIQSSYPSSNSMVFTTYFVIIVLAYGIRRKEIK